MKKTITFLLALTFMMSLSVAAFANSRSINRRERHQQQRIARGINNGELTAREVVRLERQQVQLHRYERRAKSDGVLTFRERYRLDNQLDRANRRIYRNTHDNQDRN